MRVGLVSAQYNNNSAKAFGKVFSWDDPAINPVATRKDLLNKLKSAPASQASSPVKKPANKIVGAFVRRVASFAAASL